MKTGSQMLTRPSQSGTLRTSGRQRSREATPEPVGAAASLIQVEFVAVGVGLRFLELEASAQVHPSPHHGQPCLPGGQEIDVGGLGGYVIIVIQRR